MGAIAEPCHVRRLRRAMLSADRVERNQQAAPQHIPLEWHTDFGGEEMAEASERQVALPGRVGKPDGACLDEPINRLRASHDARTERSPRLKCEPNLPDTGDAFPRDMDLQVRTRAVSGKRFSQSV